MLPQIFIFDNSSNKYNLMVASFAGTITALATFAFFPDSHGSREIALGQFFAKTEEAMTWHADVKQTSPEAFCRMFTGVSKTEAVDCYTGRSLVDFSRLKSADHLKVQDSGIADAAQMVQQYSDLMEILVTRSATDLHPTATGLQRRISTWRERLYNLEHTEEASTGETRYAAIFQLLLDVSGTYYNASADSFKKINWHIARLTDQDPAVFERSSNLSTTLKYLPYILGLCSFILVHLTLARGSLRGFCLISGWLLINWWGMLVATDASINFGEGSIVFALNPLGNQITRQAWIFGFATALIALTLSFPWTIEYLLIQFARNLWTSLTFFIALISLAYLVLGPSMGSEALKVTTAVIASLMTFKFGRSVYLTKHWSPRSLDIFLILSNWRKPTKLPASANDVIAHELGIPLVQLAVFGVIGVGLSALVFRDLGASLVSTFVLVAAVYLVFGRKIALSAVGLLSFFAALLSQTNKVQERIALMVDPLSASVSDFARLIAFSSAADTTGFPLGKINWCSQSGVCLPFQALSDYMPTVLAGLFGSRLVGVYFLLFVFTLIFICYSMLRWFIVEKGISKAIAALAFYLLLFTLAQTTVTFLGNWRLIPLTGIGAPLLSIGMSSAFIPALAVALTIHVWSFSNTRDVTK